LKKDHSRVQRGGEKSRLTDIVTARNNGRKRSCKNRKGGDRLHLGSKAKNSGKNKREEEKDAESEKMGTAMNKPDSLVEKQEKKKRRGLRVLWTSKKRRS